MKSQVEMLSIETVRGAWKQARNGGGTFDSILAREVRASPAETLMELGKLFHFPVSFLDENHQVAANLSMLGLSDCRRRFGLIVVRGGAQGLGFVGPSGETIRRWAGVCSGWRSVSRAMCSTWRRRSTSAPRRCGTRP